MILISTDFILTQSQKDANLPLIGYKNILTGANLSSTTANASYPLSNILNPSTFQVWKGTDADFSETFTIDNSGLELIDYVAFAIHNFGSTGRTIEITATLGGSPVTLIEESLIASDKPLLLRFEKAAYSEIEVVIGVAADLVTVPQAAVLHVGELLAVPRRIYVGHTPLPYARQSNVSVGLSTSGNFLGRLVVGQRLRTSVQFDKIDPAWYRANFDPFVQHSIEAPFFFAWRPLDYPDEVGYCWTPADIVPSNELSNGMMSVSMELEGVA